jgi:tetratricopeptide (TPR) repeat protein
VIVGGRFEVVREAGSGGMGVVYEARDRTTGATVAVKVLADRTHEQRFAREAEVLAGLRHPAIVGYVAHGPGTTDAPPFLAMEWLAGEDLAGRIARGPLPVDEAVALAARVADAVGTAHARGVIHRDLKPSNVFLVGGRIDAAKVLDFGLARQVLSADTRRRLTVAGAIMGSVGYLAPEQARGSTQIDARCDVFALGCVLYECLTGQPAFTGGHAVAILAKLLVEDAPRVREARPEVPAALDAVVARMLSRDPDGRPTDGFAVRDALLRVGSASSAGAEPARPAALGGDEQRVMAVILVGERREATATPESFASAAPTFISFDTAEARASMQAAVAPFGATADVAAEGTAVVALRGGAGTDQASRAARCALALRAQLPGSAIALALGLGVDGSGPVAGEVIERAASLLAIAIADPSDGVHVEQDVAALLEPRFVVARGRRGMLLHAERHALESARMLLGRVTPFVGRGRELSTLEQAVATSVAEGEASAVVVLGEAGTGKSRLREELVRTVRSRNPDLVVRVVQGDALRAQSPFVAAAAVVRAACGIDDPRAGPDAQRAAVASRVAELVSRGDDRERVTTFLAEMMGCPAESAPPALRLARESAQLMSDQITRAWTDFLGGELERAPWVLVLDDLHWIDAATVRLVDAALAAHRDRPLLVLGLGRPETATAFPSLWAGHPKQTLRLAPLSPRAADKLVRQAFAGAGPADERLVAQIVERAGGNPFVVEELVRAHALHPEGDVALPAGVLALVQARLEALDPALRRVLRAASVFGRAAPDEGIARLLGDEAIDGVRSCLRELVRREVLETTGDKPGLVRFAHDLVRDAAYAMLTEADRAVGHGLAGAWLEERGEHDASVLARHFDLARDVPRAAAWLVRAAEQALDGNDSESSRAHATRALELGAAGEMRGRALLARSMGARWAGRSVEGFDDAREAIGELAPGSVPWLSAIHHACTLGDMAGRRDAVAELVSLALTADPCDARAAALRVRVLSEAATSRYHAGDHTGGDRYLERVEAEAAPLLDDPLVAITVHWMRATAADHRGDPLGVLVHWTRIGELHARTGDRRSALACGVNRGYALMRLGLYESAESALREAIHLGGELRLSRAVAAARHNLGMALACRGELEAAVREETAAVEAFETMNDDRLRAVSRVYLAMILAMANDLERAEAVAMLALEEAAPLPPAMPRALAVLAQILLRRGNAAEAERLSARAIAALRETRVEAGDVHIRLVRVEVALATGRVEEALSDLRTLKAAIQATAAMISDDDMRAAFLRNVPENARALELAGEHGIA